MLEQFSGRWTGVNRLYLEGGNGPSLESATALAVECLLGGFLQLRYDWTYQDKPQEGVLLVGHNAKRGLVTIGWVDSFHTERRVMIFEGTAVANGVSAKGSYEVGEGPPWGWRIDLERAGEGLRITMTNISPEGAEDLAVAGEYERV